MFFIKTVLLDLWVIPLPLLRDFVFKTGWSYQSIGLRENIYCCESNSWMTGWVNFATKLSLDLKKTEYF